MQRDDSVQVRPTINAQPKVEIASKQAASETKAPRATAGGCGLVTEPHSSTAELLRSGLVLLQHADGREYGRPSAVSVPENTDRRVVSLEPTTPGP